MPRILVLNGPNLNLLGVREPAHYGSDRLSDIEQRLRSMADEADYQLDFRQSNAEHEIVDWVQAALDQDIGFIIINPAAFTHTSVAIRDALLAVNIPYIEIHLSNIHAREQFRAHSYFSDKAVGVIAGLGAQGYEYALQAAIRALGAQS